MLLTIGSLCTGYSGLEMGLRDALTEWTQVRWVADPAPGPTIVLALRYLARNYGDIATIDWQEAGPVDILTSGTPCQGFSSAGRKAGLSDARSGIIVHMFDAVRALKPRLVLWENVPTAPYEWVCDQLADCGYHPRATITAACEVGAPHLRRRVFVAALRADEDAAMWADIVKPARPAPPADKKSFLPTPTASMSTGAGGWTNRQGGMNLQTAIAAGRYQDPLVARRLKDWEAVINRPMPDPRDEKGRLSMEFAEWMMGLPYGWVTSHSSLPRKAQAQMIGNGVVPQQATLAITRLLAAAE